MINNWAYEFGVKKELIKLPLVGIGCRTEPEIRTLFIARLKN